MIDRIRCASVILGILGIVFVTGGVLLLFLGDSVIESGVKKECQLKPGTMLYKIWHDSPVPLYISIYVFDLNDTDFLNGTTKPKFKQRGPFVYKEQRHKSNIREYPNETISYQESRSYEFDPSLSSENETVNITTINIVYMTLVNFLQMELVPDIFRRIVLDLLHSQEQPIKHLTVKEFLWGYQDPLLRTLHKEFPDIVPDDQVSVFNASVSRAGLNTFLINNGVNFATNTDRIHDVGIIERFNFEPKLSLWTNEYANMINGTDSTIWHPDASQTERVYVFMSDICRSCYLEFNETYENKFDIETYRYTLPDTVYANSTDNEGFCLNSTVSNKTNELQCLPSGMFSLRRCIRLSDGSVTMPLPIIASSPHFLAADQSVRDAVIGLTPDETKHRSFIEIEPTTGIVMNGSRRMQINLNVVNDSAISEISLLKPLIYPMIWIDEHAEIDSSDADTFRNKVSIPIMALQILKYVLIGIGGALIVTVIALIIYNQYRKKKSGSVFSPTSEHF